MIVLIIISIILSAGAIVLLWLSISRVSELAKKVSESENAIGFMKADISANRKDIAALERERDSEHGLIDQITYDLDKDTVNISANLSVTGWVSSGEMKKEE